MKRLGLPSALAALTLSFLITAPSTASADDRFEVGIFGGWHWFDEDNELGVDDIQNAEALKDFAMFGARFAVNFNWLLGVEGELGLIVTELESMQVDVPTLAYRGHFILHMTRANARFRPFILAGAGALTSLSSDEARFGKDTDLSFHGGIGFKLRFGESWGFRADGRVAFPPSSNSTSHEFSVRDYEVLGGFYKTFGGSDAGEDSDGDGIPNGNDGCPNQPEDKDGFEDTDGCPDTDNDGDGIADSDDQCPNEPEDDNGIEDKDGCPESDDDNDGIVGAADKCPDQPEDMDGHQDEDGCPDDDNDGDGVADAQDACPAEPETKNGYKDDDGCPDEVPKQVKKFTGTIKGIKFKSGSDKILRSSYGVLNKAAAVLNEYNDLRLEIQGHTDDRGNNDFNMDLSQRRAESVKNYLVKQGVDASRLEARGYGEEQPIAENRNRKGRAQNRRVEFKLIQ